MYRIEYDAKDAILHVIVAGFWTMEETQRFAGEVAAELGALRRQGLRFAVLADGCDFAVQSREVTEGLMRVINASDQNNRAPTAIIVGTALSKLQAERTLTAPHVRIVSDREEAVSWLKDRLRER